MSGRSIEAIIEAWDGEAVATRFDRETGAWFFVALHDSTLGTPNGGTTYTYFWTQVTTRLRSGWDGPGGMSDRDIRAALFKELGSPDAERRKLVARTLAAMNLRGLLLAARDAGIKEAREILLEQDRPKEVKL